MRGPTNSRWQAGQEKSKRTRWDNHIASHDRPRVERKVHRLASTGVLYDIQASNEIIQIRDCVYPPLRNDSPTTREVPDPANPHHPL